jgi:two-component system chemotaxis response regulator CheB
MTPGRSARILIVDDSAVMRSLLRTVVLGSPGLEIAGCAADGESALAMIRSELPDLIVLDVEMPVMDGLVTLTTLRKRGFTMPVIMCSSLTQRGARVTIEALAAGASDYVTKPSAQVNREAALGLLACELIPRIRALTDGAPPEAVRTLQSRKEVSTTLRAGNLADSESRLSAPAIVVIGVSTGGPAALEVLLPGLPVDFPLPVLVVQHMPELFTSYLAERLNMSCRLRVREASAGDVIVPGRIYLAPGNWHMEVVSGSQSDQKPALHLNQHPPVNHCRPSVDVLFRSALAVYGSGVIAVVLTGMGSDGLAACREICARKGLVLAQDRDTSVVWGMPGAVANAGLANRVLPLNLIAPEILRLASSPRPISRSRDVQETVVQE